jgi:hypothetical protein
MDKKVFLKLVFGQPGTEDKEGGGAVAFEVCFRFRLRSQLPAEVAEKETFPDMTIFDPVS